MSSFRFCCSNIVEKKTSQVRDVVRTILFIRTVLLRYPSVLTERHWDLILISMASWIPSLQKVVEHVLSTDGDSPHVESLTPTMVRLGLKIDSLMLSIFPDNPKFNAFI